MPNSQRIQIQDRTFRWALAPDVVTFLAHEDIENHGATLRAKLMVHTRVVLCERKAVLTPRDVQRLILAAMARGWDPNGCGADRVFKLKGPMTFGDYEVL